MKVKMEISETGIRLIKKFEALRLDAYPDAVDIPTIGWGHTHGVTLGMTITEKQADELLDDDLIASESAVRSYTRIKLSQNQFDSLVSFVFNLGAGNFRKSSLLKAINGKSGSDDIRSAFMEYTHGRNHVELPGLVIRRRLEADLYLQGPSLEEMMRELNKIPKELAGTWRTIKTEPPHLIDAKG